MERWWPDKPFRDTITRHEPNRWSQEYRAAAWTWLAPEARPPLTTERWAELATSGILFSSHTDWLRDAQTLDSVYRAVGLIGEAREPERWTQLFSCCRDPIPDQALVECAAHLCPETSEESLSQSRYQLAELARRLVENGRIDLALQVAERCEAFAATLRPIRARAGDVEAQRTLMVELVKRLDRTELPDMGDLHWMRAIQMPALLPALFRVLRRSYRTSDHPAAAIGVHDLVSPTIEAIASVGGRAAVAGYDDLLADGGDLRWLRSSRANVAGEVLAVTGQRFSRVAAGEASVPVLDARL